MPSRAGTAGVTVATAGNAAGSPAAARRRLRPVGACPAVARRTRASPAAAAKVVGSPATARDGCLLAAGRVSPVVPPASRHGDRQDAAAGRLRVGAAPGRTTPEPRPRSVRRLAVVGSVRSTVSGLQSARSALGSARPVLQAAASSVRCLVVVHSVRRLRAPARSTSARRRLPVQLKTPTFERNSCWNGDGGCPEPDSRHRESLVDGPAATWRPCAVPSAARRRSSRWLW